MHTHTFRTLCFQMSKLPMILLRSKFILYVKLSSLFIGSVIDLPNFSK